MSTLFKPASSVPIVYPESDGEPMSDNTKQLRWIVTLYGNLAALFRDNPDVFVGGNQFWYPVEGEPDLKQAPDVYVVFGRPKGDRPSYKQWEEGGVPMTVVFEVLSPKNTRLEMADKLSFYEDHGAEEYYEYDPDDNSLLAYVRRGEVFRRVRQTAEFVSPRLGIRFDTSGPELVVLRPDGRPFLTFEELEAEREKEGQKRQEAEQRATSAEQRATSAEQRAARLAELGRKARRQQATPEELAELESLEDQGPPPSGP
jgi:Uma2 family endonuclease